MLTARISPLQERILEILDGVPLMTGPETVDYVYERLPDFEGSWWDLAKHPVADLKARGFIDVADDA